MAKKFTREETIARLIAKHGDEYDYSLITDDNYVNYLTPVPIICNKHGVFYQIPRLHANGCGCPYCYGTPKLTTEDFIRRAKETHGDKYDYSNVVYVDSKTPVCIICPKHGEFYQRPYLHLSGNGCPSCEMESRKGRANLKIRKLIQGVGILDIDCSAEKDAEIQKAAQTWRSILVRCYTKNKKTRNNAITYQDCYICDEWKRFSNFFSWWKRNYVEGYAIDKDIIKKGNRCYCPEYCSYVPVEINNLILTHKAQRGDYPIGVIRVKRKRGFRFIAQMGYKENGVRKCKVFGTFKSADEAFFAYKQGKESYVRLIAQSYYEQGKINERVYQALLRYEIDIND